MQNYKRFGVTEELLRKTLSEALKCGGDYADLFFEDTLVNSVTLRDGEVNSAASSVDYGVGVRVIDGERTGYAYSESINEKELLAAARLARNIASTESSSASVSDFLNIQNQSLKSQFYGMKKKWFYCDIKEKAPYLRDLNSRIYTLDSRVSTVVVSLTDSVQEVLFCNSDGVVYSDQRPLVTLSVMCVMQHNGRLERANVSRSFRMGAEFLNYDLVEELAVEVVKQGQFLFQATQPKGGEMSVVMAAGGSGILLHEAIGHAFEADFIRKGTSIFSESLGKKICNDHISVIDDATIENNRGSIQWDDEGVEGQRTYLVKDGVLENFMNDRISAKALGMAQTGNGRRESFRFYPIPRMRATYMENGNCSEEDLIREVKRGVYVDNFSNGEVQIGAGDFSFFVKTGYLIEDGHLTTPLKDFNVIGNGPQALADILMVANNGRIDNGSWMCGKDGQSCPVTCGMPSVLVKKLVVG